jgi:carbon monoxide dehydrogenase subunit G
MRMTGERVLSAPQDAVWRALNDPEVLRQSIPGCESFEQTGSNAYRAVVATRIGPVQARFAGNITLFDLDPPSGYTISGEGSGGVAGGAKGSAQVRLEPAGVGTRLTWAADAQISGKLAQIGSRLIESAANMMAGQFFDRFQQIVAGEALPERRARVLPLWVWVAAFILSLAAFLLLR